MAFAASRCLFNTVRTSLSKGSSLSSNVNASRSILRGESGRTFTRSMWHMSNQSKESDVNILLGKHAVWSKTCGCGMHTENTAMMLEYLKTDIENEKSTLQSVPPPKGYAVKQEGANITLTKQHGDTLITVKMNLNHSTPTDIDEAYEGEEAEAAEEAVPELVSVPDLEIFLTKGSGPSLFFWFQAMEGAIPAANPENVPEEEETEFPWPYSVFEVGFANPGDEKQDIKNYVISGQVMDGSLHDMHLNMLEDLGVDNQFLDELFKYTTAEEHRLYIKFLEQTKDFVAK
ncbi:unnamed protein product [Owenia fusiformis]|uniref:Complement component 1 Q subcomponent-binding protein, mitochondrial n=1 Tax=Owenia fusiformis TaxID=6347 RepID=A0A8S4Q5S2_OWEFU|nr:unnamed protein product [Owenia fusiformis]